jgi:two-component system sensor histidine kinase AlgZ
MTIMPNPSSIPLPDFRNLGVLLRAALGVQVLTLLTAAARTPGLFAMLSDYTASASLVVPPLLLTLLLLFALGPWLSRLPFAQGGALVLMLAVSCALLWRLGLATQRESLTAGQLLQTGLLAASASGAMLLYFNWRHRVLSPALSEARLQALQARIRPHFLFNSLNTVLGLMRGDPRRAEAVLENLADLFRMLMADNRDLSPLGRELELARAYVQVEETRLGERLRVAWKVDNAALPALLPPLVLQPLLENAIYHGVEPNPQGGDVRVDIFVLDDRLNIVVRNPARADGGHRTGNRMALSNIRERLALHFDAEARLATHVAGGEFFVQIVLPLKVKPDAEHPHRR